MAFKNKLLATAAIPLIALMGMGSVSAAELLRPTAPAEVQSLVIKVQADEEELLKQKRQERREKRQQQKSENAGQNEQTDQEQVKPRRKKQSDDAQMQDDSGQMQQTTDQEQVKPRRKKQQDNAEAQQTDQEQVKPRRKKQSDDAQMQAQDNADQAQQTDQEQVKPRRKKQQDDADQAQQTDQEQVKPRRKKQQDNAAAEQNQSDDEQLKNAIDNNKKQRKQNKAADEQQMQQDNADQAQQTDEEQVKPRRKKQQDNASSDENQSSDDKLKNAIDKNKRKKNQDQAEQPADDNGEADQAGRKKRERPVDVKKAQDIAEDPSKTTDTVVLPVENGAAVLDSDKDADNKGGTDRNRRKREREEVKARPAPKSDEDAQRGFKEDKEIRIKPVLELKGERIPGFKGYDDFGGRRVGDRDNRVVITIGGKIVIRSDDDRRIARDTEIRYERLPNNLVREVVIQPNGDRIITVRNRYGEIVRRSRIQRDNREIVIFYSPDLERGRDRLFLRDPGDDLPPMRLRIPVDDYIIDVSGNGGRRNYEQFLEQPPVEQVERVYSVDEVKNSARIRDKMRRIDLDTITFETGSADVAEDQVQSLKQVGQAIKRVLDKDPGETFLIEGHTDAVGSDESNLVLSDQRSESIANVLSEAFDIPAENLVTQGYGERYLKIDSDGPERENRRVTIRRITPLVRPLEAAEK